MTPQRWQRIEELFRTVAERPLVERESYLTSACADDEDLRREVLELLAHQTAESFLDNPIKHAAHAVTDAPASEFIGQRVGPYRLTRLIGRGGMGTVYEAVRDDDEFQQQVAIKLIKHGMDSAFVRERFLRERQILASLDHPHIARLLDGGTTTEGQPYFVMELVTGEPITAYCNQRRLSLEEKLKLFRDVCAAVQHAHQKLVVHRDLKPSNILVNAQGSPKLLDFGIAKLLAPDPGEAITSTESAVRLMTPDYASPEQLRGGTITTATDVYSLGVVLYELLTARRPFQFETHAPLEIARIVCDTEAPRPSDILEGMRDSKGMRDEGGGMRFKRIFSSLIPHPSSLLRGDLDNIVLMALRKEPQRRYASVEQFSEDLRRHLAGLPVIARQDTFGYRTSKFILRNKAAVIAASVVAMLVIAFLITLLVQSVRLARERDRAERERVKAEKVSAFLVDLFKVNDPGEARGNKVTAREILDKGADKIRAELKDQPEVQATLLHNVGQVFYSLGLYERSAALLEEALQQRRVVLGHDHPDVARTLTALVQTIFELNQMERAETLTRESLAIRRTAYGNEHPDVAESLNDLALLTKLKGDLAAAEPLYRETIAVQRKLQGSNSPAVATTLHNLAILLADKKDFAGAETAQREALTIRRQAFGSDAPDVATTMHNLASILRRKGDYAGAEQTLRETLAIRRKLYPDGHPDTALTLQNLGTLKRDQHEYAQSETYLRECLAIRLKTLPADHSFIGRTHIELGRVLAPQQKYAEALTALNEGLRIAQKTTDKTYTPHALDGLGDLHFAQKKYAEAEPFFLKAYEQYQALKESERTKAVKEKLVKLYEAWGKPEKAALLKQQE